MMPRQDPSTRYEQRRSSFMETAYDWLQRSKKRRAREKTPRDSSSAAWSFFRNTKSKGTGIAFVDAALRPQTGMDPRRFSAKDSFQSLPVIDIRGDVGKTWTLMTIAARFIVTTRPSQFRVAVPVDQDGDEVLPDSSRDQQSIDSSSDLLALPHVIIFDSKGDIVTPKLAHIVRSTLLRLSKCSQFQFEEEMRCCLERIHVSTASDITEWPAILELLRYKLKPLKDQHPTLILWDGFLSEPTVDNEASRMEVIRQVARLLQECQVVLVTTSSTRKRINEWEKLVTHRIRLERKNQSTTNTNAGSNVNDYYAVVHGDHIPFSISMAGILS